MNISVLILAAGSSSRMARIKQLLPYKNSTLLAHSIEQALASKANKVYCVLGNHSEEIMNQVKTNKVIFIDNPNWETGLGSSIVTGVSFLQSLENAPQAILIMLADQPFVDSHYIDLLINKYFEKPESIMASNYGNKNGVPAIFPKKSFTSLLKLKGDKGAKQLLNDGISNVISVSPKLKSTLLDIDTPEDYNRLI